jgi:hypothetical protein
MRLALFIKKYDWIFRKLREIIQEDTTALMFVMVLTY